MPTRYQQTVQLFVHAGDHQTTFNTKSMVWFRMTSECLFCCYLCAKTKEHAQFSTTGDVSTILHDHYTAFALAFSLTLLVCVIPMTATMGRAGFATMNVTYFTRSSSHIPLIITIYYYYYNRGPLSHDVGSQRESTLYPTLSETFIISVYGIKKTNRT